MSDIAISVEHLSKRYLIGARERGYQTLRDTLATAFTKPWTRQSAPEIWPLKDVSLTVPRGEVLGVIGANGAGKTTLLKILSRITAPTEGRAVIWGRVGSLLEVGTGFHPELTGRENIYLNGAILNMMRAEISRKFDAIVEFSGVEQFIDTPVKRYSSGMYVRLAFAVAAHLDPEILLVDEVLAVGDAAFQEKCLGKMREVARGGRTVLLVSHNMAAIRHLCTRVLFLEAGRIQFLGTAAEAIAVYLAGIQPSGAAVNSVLSVQGNRTGNGHVRAVSFEARPSDRKSVMPRTGADVEFLIGYEAKLQRPLIRLHGGFWVVNADGNTVFGCGTGMTPLRDFRDMPPRGTICCRVKTLPLIPGTYSVNLVLKDDQGIADLIERAASFTVADWGESGLTVNADRSWGSVTVPHEWSWISDQQETAVEVPAGDR